MRITSRAISAVTIADSTIVATMKEKSIWKPFSPPCAAGDAEGDAPATDPNDGEGLGERSDAFAENGIGEDDINGDPADGVGDGLGERSDTFAESGTGEGDDDEAGREKDGLADAEGDEEGAGEVVGDSDGDGEARGRSVVTAVVRRAFHALAPLCAAALVKSHAR